MTLADVEGEADADEDPQSAPVKTPDVFDRMGYGSSEDGDGGERTAADVESDDDDRDLVAPLVAAIRRADSGEEPLSPSSIGAKAWALSYEISGFVGTLDAPPGVDATIDELPVFIRSGGARSGVGSSVGARAGARQHAAKDTRTRCGRAQGRGRRDHRVFTRDWHRRGGCTRLRRRRPAGKLASSRRWRRCSSRTRRVPRCCAWRPGWCVPRCSRPRRRCGRRFWRMDGRRRPPPRGVTPAVEPADDGNLQARSRQGGGCRVELKPGSRECNVGFVLITATTMRDLEGDEDPPHLALREALENDAGWQAFAAEGGALEKAGLGEERGTVRAEAFARDVAHGHGGRWRRRWDDESGAPAGCSSPCRLSAESR